MKKIIYIICLLAAFSFGSILPSTLLTPIFMLTANIPGASHVVMIIVKLLSPLLPMLVLFRVFIFIKTRSLAIPDNFTGGAFVFGCIAVAPAVITIAGYIYFINAAVSGVPLGMAAALTGILSAIIVLYCEFKAFYASIPEG